MEEDKKHSDEIPGQEVERSAVDDPQPLYKFLEDNALSPDDLDKMMKIIQGD